MPAPLDIKPKGGGAAAVASFDAAGNESIVGNLTVSGGVINLGLVAAAPNPVPGALILYTLDGVTLQYVAAGGQAANQTITGTLTVTGPANIGGNLSITTAGKGLLVKEGSNAKQGTATLTAGAAVVANTSVTATSRILLTSQADGGTPGFLRVSARTAGTSFTITSSSGTDTSTVAYQIFEPA